MELVIMYLVAIAAVGIVGFMLVKKMDIKISLFLIGIVLMYIALLMGKDISFTDFVSSGVTWLDPFKVVGDQFVSTLTSAGFIILILGGYTGYMSHIGANEVTVSVLAKPIAHIKSPVYPRADYLLVGQPVVSGHSECFQPGYHPYGNAVPGASPSWYEPAERSCSHCHYCNDYADPAWLRQCCHRR